MIDQITTGLNALTALNGAIVLYIPSAVGVAATIARFLPPPKRPGFAAKVHKFVNWLGQNAGHAENKQ